MPTDAPITAETARFGVFYLSRPSQPATTWRDALFGPVQMVAAATNEHTAAMAAVLHLVAMDETNLALVIRDRDKARNVACIRWIELCSGAGCYRFSDEQWAQP
jgi:hypothetical protein